MTIDDPLSASAVRSGGQHDDLRKESSGKEYRPTVSGPLRTALVRVGLGGQRPWADLSIGQINHRRFQGVTPDDANRTSVLRRVHASDGTALASQEVTIAGPVRSDAEISARTLPSPGLVARRVAAVAAAASPTLAKIPQRAALSAALVLPYGPDTSRSKRSFTFSALRGRRPGTGSKQSKHSWPRARCVREDLPLAGDFTN